MNLDFPHRRYNPLTGEWVLVSPQRTKRPWLGQTEKPADHQLPSYDPKCYLCPGNERSSGIRNPDYDSTYVFENDFPALQMRYPEEVAGGEAESTFFVAEPVSGRCRVVCFSPRHDLTLPELPREQVVRVVETWSREWVSLMGEEEIQYVQIFENKGEMMGCSNPHPHSQIWASSVIPNEPLKEITNMGNYLNTRGHCLICDSLASEIQDGRRIVACNPSFTALVPFWAVWPYEVLLVSNRHTASIGDLSTQERVDLADILQNITIRYDNLFQISFAYSMGFHQQAKGAAPDLFHFHAHFYPPLLRSATVKKFMVGYEMLAMPQRDIPPEAAAEQLRNLPQIHYKHR